MVEPQQRNRRQELHDLSVALGARCSHPLRGRSARPTRKAAPDTPGHPGWPPGSPNSLGGKFEPKDGVLSVGDIPAGSSKRPVSLRDRDGNLILREGKPILRPADLPPDLYIRQGQGFQQNVDAAEAVDPALGVSAAINELGQMSHNGPLDAQRVDGKFVSEYRDDATIAIGLHNAAAGIPLEQSLSLQNDYAMLFSTFGNEKMDDVYTHLPARNVDNTKFGYWLYQSGSMRAQP